MNETQKLISFCKEQVIAGRNITIKNASLLFKTPEEKKVEILRRAS